MANLEAFKDRAKKFEAKEQWAKAVEEYARAIAEMEAGPEIPEAELALYNKAGDLYQKIGQSQNAVAHYERALDKYQEIGLAANAMALCKKILRLAPGRVQIYLKLGILSASKGFGAEAKTNLLEYADRMQKAGQLEEAFKALKKFAEMTPGQGDIWSVLAQQARATARTPEQKEQVEKLLGEFEAKDRSVQHRRSRMSRHMLTGEELPPETPIKKGELIFLDVDAPPAPRRSAAAAPPSPPPRPAEKAPPARKARPAARPAPAPEPEVEKLEIEPTALVSEELPPEPAEPPLPMLEIEDISLVGQEEAAAEPPLEILPTSLAEVEPEPESAEAAEPAELGAADFVESEPVAEAMPEVAAAPEAEAGAEPAEGGALQFLDVEAAPAADAQESASSLEALPLLEGEDALTVREAPASGEEPAAEEELSFLDVGELVAPPTAEELEARIAANAEDWEAHRLLAEVLTEAGERERAFAEFDVALEGHEQFGELDEAYAIAEEVLRLEPNSVRYHQKRVELSYRQGDRPRLAGAYLELADALLRSGQADKAVAVYQRVLEHDPANDRAKSAIETLAPAPAPAGRASRAPAPAPEPAGGFVDLGAMLLDEEGPKDTRMRIEDEEPSGDEEKDFQTMLAAFKKGVEANVEDEDFQSHYDLGVAYKEMGLLDEAIAEFQKALRGADGRLRSSEALGLCFYEKGQFTVAETILRRALELPASGDAERVGLLYWLGRTQEELGKSPDALHSYNRVFAVDITFQDVSQRVKTLSRAGA